MCFLFLYGSNEVIVSLFLVCYCVCSLSLNTFAFGEIIYENLKFKTSPKDINMTNPIKGNDKA